MRNKNYYINLNDREYLDVLSSLMNKRNKLIQSGKYTDGIDEVIMKIKKAKKRNFRVLYLTNLYPRQFVVSRGIIVTTIAHLFL